LPSTAACSRQSAFPDLLSPILKAFPSRNAWVELFLGNYIRLIELYPERCSSPTVMGPLDVLRRAMRLTQKVPKTYLLFRTMSDCPAIDFSNNMTLLTSLLQTAELTDEFLVCMPSVFCKRRCCGTASLTCSKRESGDVSRA
jgi:hypothetical protein